MIELLRRSTRAHRGFLKLAAIGLCVHLVVSLAASRLPEMADEPSFKHWAVRSSVEPLSEAYLSDTYHYDWLPLYIYLNKAVGVVYRLTGLYERRGPESRVLTFGLKLPMIALCLLTCWFVYLITGQTSGKGRHALYSAAAWILNPAIILAIDVFGYQEALHTAFVVAAALLLLNDRSGWAGACGALGILTKPQAMPYILAGGAYVLFRSGSRPCGRLIVAGVIAATAALLPFIVAGRMGSVLGMFFGVTHVDEVLSACAHNFWGLFWPAPPFHSDRAPLALGVSGLQVGLGLVALFTVFGLTRIRAHPTPRRFLHVCAYAGFAFFMVSTEMHENYSFALYPFLAVFAAESRVARFLFLALTLTLSVNLSTLR